MKKQGLGVEAMPVIPATPEVEVRGSQSEASQAKVQHPIWKNSLKANEQGAFKGSFKSTWNWLVSEDFLEEVVFVLTNG
jgi:hypothetical protein